MAPINFMLIGANPANSETFRTVMSEIEPAINCSMETDPIIALEKVVRDKYRPDLILMNLDMSEVSGWEIIQTLKMEDCSREIPVCLYAAELEEEDVERSKSEGAACIFPEPSNADELKGSLERIVGSFQDGRLEDQESFLDWQAVR